MIDPGVIAAVIFGGIPTATIGWFGGTRAVRGVVGWHRARQIEAARWTAHKEIAEDGTIFVSVQRKAGKMLIQRRSVGAPLAPDTDDLEVDVRVWEAQRRAGLYNDE